MQVYRWYRKERHKAFKTFNELKEFYFSNRDKLDIYDEYGDEFTCYLFD